MSKTEVQLCYNRFKEGRKDINDDDRPGRPNTLTTNESIEAVKKMILDNSRITIREIGNDVGISFGSCQEIFTEVLGMKHATANTLKKLLNFEQKQNRLDLAQKMLTTSNDDAGLIKKFLTDHESWMYGNDIETKTQLCQWKSYERKTHVKFSQIWRFCSLFSSIAMA